MIQNTRTSIPYNIIYQKKKIINKRNTLKEVAYFFAERPVRGSKSISLAVDCRVSTASNGIHFPLSVVIVHHMEVAMSASANFRK